MKRFFCAMAVFGILGLGAQAALADLSVKVIVTEQTSGEKIAGAVITARGGIRYLGDVFPVSLRMLTGANGEYSFNLVGDVVPPLEICAKKKGYTRHRDDKLLTSVCANLRGVSGSVKVPLVLVKKPHPSPRGY